MNNANLSQEISRLYKDLSDHILARDWEGTSRIYQELLRAGQTLDMLIARVPALQNTSALKLFGQPQAAQEHGLGAGVLAVVDFVGPGVLPAGSRTVPEIPATPAADCAITAEGASNTAPKKTHRYTRFIKPPHQALNF